MTIYSKNLFYTLETLKSNNLNCAEVFEQETEKGKFFFAKIICFAY